MPLIDKVKTVSAIATYLFVNDAIKGPEPRRVVDYETFARSMLKDVPEQDIVRCKECIYSKESDGFYKCNYSAVWRKSTDYCSYGERSE